MWTWLVTFQLGLSWESGVCLVLVIFIFSWLIHFISFRECYSRSWSSHLTALTSVLWSCCNSPSNFVNGHMSTVWIMVCCLPQLHVDNLARLHFCRFAWHRPWPVQKRLSRDYVWQVRLKPGCHVVRSVATVWLTTEANDQSSLSTTWSCWQVSCLTILGTRMQATEVDPQKT